MYNGDNEFITSLTGALSTILSEENGKGVVDDLIISDKTLFIIENDQLMNQWDPKNKTILWDYRSDEGGNNEINSNKRPAFIGLAHELGHAHRNFSNKGFTGKWTENLPKSEIYATHIENQVRAEHNISLRTHYYKNSENTRIVSGEYSKYFFTPGRVFPNPYNYRRR